MVLDVCDKEGPIRNCFDGDWAGTCPPPPSLGPPNPSHRFAGVRIGVAPEVDTVAVALGGIGFSSSKSTTAEARIGVAAHVKYLLLL